MSEVRSLFDILRQSADPGTAAAIERLVAEAPDRRLTRINALAFAAANGLDEENAIAGFLHACRLGLFDISWNVLCPGCGGVLDANTSLKTVRADEYSCALCASGYEPTLDEMVEVTFTVSPRVRRIEAHDPNSLPLPEYFRQVYLGSGIDLAEEGYEDRIEQFIVESLELPPGDKAIFSLHLEPGQAVMFEPVTHGAEFMNIGGEPTRERQQVSLVFDRTHRHNEVIELRPGAVRITVENQTDVRALPSLCLLNDALHDIMGHRRPFLTAKRLLSNQTFRDIYRADTLTVDQRLRITSLTFLFTDLRGSTELYERVGDLAAFDLVRTHFGVLNAIVAAEAGAVVKTIGDAVMATFPTPDRALSAAMRMREAMAELNRERGSEDLLLKIGIHEGPCIAVSLNERQDYFGQTVNIASRVQHLAASSEILATASVLDHPGSGDLLRSAGLSPVSHASSLRGISRDVPVYAIP